MNWPPSFVHWSERLCFSSDSMSAGISFSGTALNAVRALSFATCRGYASQKVSKASCVWLQESAITSTGQSLNASLPPFRSRISFPNPCKPSSLCTDFCRGLLRSTSIARYFPSFSARRSTRPPQPSPRSSTGYSNRTENPMSRSSSAISSCATLALSVTVSPFNRAISSGRRI